jgi:hypothetical protein
MIKHVSFSAEYLIPFEGFQFLILLYFHKYSLARLIQLYHVFKEHQFKLDLLLVYPVVDTVKCFSREDNEMTFSFTDSSTFGLKQMIFGPFSDEQLSERITLSTQMMEVVVMKILIF